MKHLLPLLALLFLNHFSFAQGEGMNWTFGNGLLMNFSSGSPVATASCAITTSEGCATMSDASGILLFYTDGISVWDKNNNLMPNGSGLGGNFSSTQSAIIVPQPGSTNIYFVFTVDALTGPNGLQFVKVDMNLNGGLGDVIAGAPTQLITPSCEKVTATTQANGMDWWIMAHEWNTNNFVCYSLTSSGLNMTPIISSIGTIYTDVGGAGAESIGYMKFSPDGNMIGCSVYEMLNVFDLYSFNKNTGQITALICSDNNFQNQSGLSGPYGFSFSPDNSKAYVACFGLSPDPSELFQYDVSSGNGATILASKTLIASSTLEAYGALQLGVDQKIYLCKYGASFLDKIDQPNNLGVASSFVLDAIPLPATSNFGLPDFFEGYFVTGLVGQLTYNGCTGQDNFIFLDTTLNDTYTLHWDFGVAAATDDTSNIAHPTFNFPAQGSYIVTLTVNQTNNGSFTITHTIVTGGEMPVFAGNDTSICTSTALQLNVDVSNANYLWSPVVNLSCSTCQNPVASPVTQTTYIVNVTTAICYGADTIVVSIIPPTVATVFSDTSICIGAEATLHAFGGSKITWYPNYQLDDTASSTAHATPLVTTTYFAIVDGENGCPTDTSSLVVNVWQLPTVEAGITITLTEGEEANLNGTSSGISNYWYPAEDLSNKNILTPSFTASTDKLYHLVTSDQNGCVNVDSVHVIVLPAFLLFPNAFSPNADDVNDDFKYFVRGITSVKIAVYNRWGEQVFYSENMGDFWNGTFKDLKCPMGVYIYTAKAVAWSGRKIETKGNVTLLR